MSWKSHKIQKVHWQEQTTLCVIAKVGRLSLTSVQGVMALCKAIMSKWWLALFVKLEMNASILTINNPSYSAAATCRLLMFHCIHEYWHIYIWGFSGCSLNPLIINISLIQLSDIMSTYFIPFFCLNSLLLCFYMFFEFVRSSFMRVPSSLMVHIQCTGPLRLTVNVSCLRIHASPLQACVVVWFTLCTLWCNLCFFIWVISSMNSIPPAKLTYFLCTCLIKEQLEYFQLLPSMLCQLHEQFIYFNGHIYEKIELLKRKISIESIWRQYMSWFGMLP